MKNNIFATTMILSMIVLFSCSKKTDTTVFNSDVTKTLNTAISLNLAKDESLIIGTKESHEFLLFENGSNGLILFWPIIEDKYLSNKIETERLFSELKKQEFVKVNMPSVDDTKVKNLRVKEFVTDSEGMYANVGNNSEQILKLTTSIFQSVFNAQDLSKITATIEKIDGDKE
jgi:hypothetical protein